MNKKIAITLLVLCIVYMAIFYVIKFIFPELLLLQIKDPNIIAFGEFFLKSKWYEYGLNLFTAFITFYLFVCASRGKFTLNFKEFLIVFIASVVNAVTTILFPEIMVHTSTSIMFLASMLCGGTLNYSTISFVVYGYASQFLLQIRGFETVIQYFTPATGIIFSLECWVWLIIFALIFKLREDNKNGTLCTTIHR